MKLDYMGFDLEIECSKTSDCECDYCKMFRFILELLATLLKIACENDLIEHYNFLVMNCDAMFGEAAERLQSEKTIH